MKTFFNSKVLSAALIAAAFAAAGSAPASAQALSHDGSLMPHYFDKDGELKWGGWGPPAAEQKVASVPHHTLYLSARKHPQLYAGRNSHNTSVR
jgi:hypothetical protein